MSKENESQQTEITGYINQLEHSIASLAASPPDIERAKERARRRDGRHSKSRSVAGVKAIVVLSANWLPDLGERISTVD
jgi:hypothetical protein